MRGISFEQLIVIFVLVLWPIFQLIARAKKAAAEAGEQATDHTPEVEHARPAEVARAIFAEPSPPLQARPPRVQAPPRIPRHPPPPPPARQFDRRKLRSAIIAMTVLGPPRALEHDDR
jgi:hypothetical protein